RVAKVASHIRIGVFIADQDAELRGAEFTGNPENCPALACNQRYVEWNELREKWKYIRQRNIFAKRDQVHFVVTVHIVPVRIDEDGAVVPLLKCCRRNLSCTNRIGNVPQVGRQICGCTCQNIRLVTLGDLAKGGLCCSCVLCVMIFQSVRIDVQRVRRQKNGFRPDDQVCLLTREILCLRNVSCKYRFRIVIAVECFFHLLWHRGLHGCDVERRAEPDGMGTRISVDADRSKNNRREKQWLALLSPPSFIEENVDCHNDAAQAVGSNAVEGLNESAEVVLRMREKQPRKSREGNSTDI